MNGVQEHLLLNHFPLFLSLIGGLELLCGWLLKQTAIENFGLFLICCSALMIIPTYKTGPAAMRSGINAPRRLDFIHAHEKKAKPTLILVLVQGAFSLALLLLNLRKKRFPQLKLVRAAFSLFLITVFCFLAVTAHSGGLISHEAIRPPPWERASFLSRLL